MPLKLNVGLTKKVGQRDYGSLGASCHVEAELDGTLLQNDLEAFHRHVKNAYTACSQAVNDELARQQARGTDSQQQATTTGANGNGQHAAGGDHGTTSHRASQKQLDYAAQLAGQIRGLGVRRLEKVAAKMFSKPLADLTSLEASGLIDVLKDIKAGKIDSAAVLEGTAQ